MNVWMKRTAGVVMISAGLVAGGATAASAAVQGNPGPTYDFSADDNETQQVQDGSINFTGGGKDSEFSVKDFSIKSENKFADQYSNNGASVKQSNIGGKIIVKKNKF